MMTLAEILLFLVTPVGALTMLALAYWDMRRDDRRRAAQKD